MISWTPDHKFAGFKLQFYTVTYGIAQISKWVCYVTIRCIVCLKFDFGWQLLKELKLLVEQNF